MQRLRRITYPLGGAAFLLIGCLGAYVTVASVRDGGLRPLLAVATVPFVLLPFLLGGLFLWRGLRGDAGGPRE